LGTYGGLIYNNLEARPRDYLLEEINKIKTLTVYSNPYNRDDIFKERYNNMGFTQYLKLNIKCTKIDLGEWSTNHKRSLKKSKTLDLLVEQTESHEDWKNYFSIYKTNILGRGALSSNSYSRELFNHIYKLDTSLRSLFIVKEKGKMQSGGLFFHFNKKCHYWHGASLPEGRENKASFLLFYNVLEFAKNKGFEFFDFMPSGGNEGVVKFKMGFGTTKVEFPIFRN